MVHSNVYMYVGKYCSCIAELWGHYMYMPYTKLSSSSKIACKCKFYARIWRNIVIYMHSKSRALNMCCNVHINLAFNVTLWTHHTTSTQDNKFSPKGQTVLCWTVAVWCNTTCCKIIFSSGQCSWMHHHCWPGTCGGYPNTCNCAPGFYRTASATCNRMY